MLTACRSAALYIQVFFGHSETAEQTPPAVSMKTLLCCVGATLVRSIRHPLFIMLGTLLFVGSAATQPRPETYHEYVARSTVVASDYAALAAALRESQDPLITMEDLEPLVASNMAFIDGSTAGRSGVVTPSSAAHIAVPLLVQAVRDWTEAGAAQRATTYAPLVEALQPTLPHAFPHTTLRHLAAPLWLPAPSLHVRRPSTRCCEPPTSPRRASG